MVDLLGKLMKGEHLCVEESYTCMDILMSDSVSDIKKTALLTAISTNGANTEEIIGLARSMRDHALDLEHGDIDVLEIVGTGGDMANTFNISTAAALICASAGVHVAKHGNRAASSKCGTADCLEALGVKLDISPKKSAKILRDVGICFMFAQIYHPSMKYIAPIRREIGVPTVFNMLGPLTNPARPTYQLLGVYDKKLMRAMGEVLLQLGVKRGLVVHGKDGLDELSLVEGSYVLEFDEKGIREYDLDPEMFGLVRCEARDLVGGTPEENAHLMREILAGREKKKLSATLLNAGAGLFVAGKTKTIAEGIDLARSVVASGNAIKTLEVFIQATNS